MKQRCLYHKDYAGRGIKVCDRWHDFAEFHRDMGTPSPGMTLDRIDNDGNYEPGNVRWASRLEQANNRRTNVTLTYKGVTLTLAGWGRSTGFGKDVISGRYTMGWPVEEILTRPPRKTQQTRKEP